MTQNSCANCHSAPINTVAFRHTDEKMTLALPRMWQLRYVYGIFHHWGGEDEKDSVVTGTTK
jgi:hypothetical protein